MKSASDDVMATGKDIPPPMARNGLFVLTAFYGSMCIYGSWKGFTGNFDTGTVELMAVNIAKGDDFPLFWYGLHYAGALEAYVAAAMIRLFGFSELVLTLSPIAFSMLWIIGVYLLFTEILNRRAGLIASVAVVFSGYFSWYYSFALSGGYSIILALGTIVLWLGVRVYKHNPSFPRLWMYVVTIGLLSALAIWVHFFIFPYLLVTAFFLLLYVARYRFAPKILCCYGVGAAIAACGLLPYLLANQGNVTGSSISSFILTRQHLSRSLHTLFTHDLSQYFFWKDGSITAFDPILIYGLFFLVVLLITGSALLFFVRHVKGPRVIILSLPVLYLVIFFCMFLPHKMSTIPSPRYLLGPWAMLVPMIWAYASELVTGKRGKVLFITLFFFWIVYNSYGNALFLQQVAPIKVQGLQELADVLDLTGSHGLRVVTMLGNERYGYEGQKLSAFSGNRIKFMFSGKERYQKNAQFSEKEANYGLMCRREDSRQVLAALQPLNISFKQRTAGKNVLFFNFRIKDFFQRKSIDPDEFSIHLTGAKKGQAIYLADRNGSTAVSWEKDGAGSLIIDFGRKLTLDGFWLFAPLGQGEGEVVGLPGRYSVSAAFSDRVFRSVCSFRSRVTKSYIQGEHVYVSGYFGKAECRFKPLRARYLKISFPGVQKISLNEVVFFQSFAMVQEPVERDLDRIFRLLKKNDIKFTLTDRWLSAAILERASAGSSLPVLPRFNPRADNQAYSRLLIPRKGLVLASTQEVADECEKQIVSLYGQGAIRRRIDLVHYSLFFLNQTKRKKAQDGLLYWNGHILVRLTDYDDLAFIDLSRTGIIHVDPARVRATGFYSDSWTNGRGILKKLHLQLPESVHDLVLIARGYAPLAGDPEALHLRVLVDGSELELSHRQGNSYIFSLPSGVKMIEEIRIESLNFNPGPQDNRILGLDVARLLVQ